MIKKICIGWFKYILLIVCFSKLIMPGLGLCLHNFYNNDLAIEIINTESEDHNLEEVLNKKLCQAYFVNIRHFNFSNQWVSSLMSNFIIDDKNAFQYFYPRIFTPPPNS